MNSYVNLGRGGTYLSAYGIAVKHGYTGTEEEWLKALKGDPGESLELAFDKAKNQLCYKTPSQAQWQELAALEDLVPEIQGAALQQMETLLADTRQAAQIAEDSGGSAVHAAAAVEQARAESAAASAQAMVSAAEAKQAEEAAVLASQQIGADAQAAKDAAQLASAVQTAALNTHGAVEAAKEEAGQAASMAQGYGNESKDAAKLSESWAVGGTGIRAGESADNAKYWADQAKSASDVGPHAASTTESTMGVHGIRYYGGYLQCLEDGEWVDASFPGAKESVVVGTEKSGHTARDCDFLCTGTDDQNILAQAIDALGGFGSGSLYLLEGEYHLSAPVTVELPTVRITGAGANTVLLRKFKSNYLSGEEIAGGMLVLGENCRELVLADFVINGNIGAYAADSNGAIAGMGTGRVTLHRMTLKNSPSSVTVMGSLHATDCVFDKTYYAYAHLGGVLIRNSFGEGTNTIGNCIAMDNEFNKANLQVHGNCKISRNTFQDMPTSGAINISAETYFTCSENIFRNCKYSVYASNILGGTISGNIMQNSDMAIRLTNCRQCNIQGNTIYRGEGKSTDYTTAQHTVLLYNSTGCTVCGNALPGKEAMDMSANVTNVIGNNRIEALA